MILLWLLLLFNNFIYYDAVRTTKDKELIFFDGYEYRPKGNKTRDVQDSWS